MKPVSPRALSRTDAVAPQVLSALRDAIVTGALPPGTAMSEADVARLYGVSRQPVREAFIRLRDAGLVSIRPQRGTMVERISVTAVMDGRFVREAVEVAIAREAARLRPAGLAGMLRAQLADQRRAAGRDDGPAFLELDELFHRTLAESIGRDFAWRVLDGIKAQMDRVRYLSFAGATPLGELIRQHGAIADAVAAGDEAAAEGAMRTHLSEILRSLPRIAEAYPDYFIADASA